MSKQLAKKTLSGFIWQSFSVAAQGIVNLLVIAVLARILSPAEFGLVSASVVVINFLVVFSQFGIGPALVQFPELSEKHIQNAFWTLILIALVFVSLVWCLAEQIESFFRLQGLIPIVQFLSFAVLIEAVAVVPESLLLRELDFKKVSSIQAVSFIFGYGLCGILAAVYGFGVYSLVIAHVSQVVIKTILLLFNKKFTKGLSLDIYCLRQLFVFGYGLTLARFGNFIANSGDYFIVARILGAGALGFYEKAYQLMAMPAVLFGKVMDKVFFPILSKAQKDKKILSDYYLKTIILLGSLMFPFAVVGFILADDLIGLVLGEGWQEAVVPFQILALGLFFRSSSKISDALTRASGWVYRRAWRQWAYAAFVCTGAFFGSNWGLQGVAIGVLFALLLNYFLMAQLSLKIAELSWGRFFRVHVKPFLVSTLLFLVLSWFDRFLVNLELLAVFRVILIITLSFICSLGLIVSSVNQVFGMSVAELYAKLKRREINVL